MKILQSVVIVLADLLREGILKIDGLIVRQVRSVTSVSLTYVANGKENLELTASN
jgi:hypothetical protein